jgi:hypothetical protein
MIYGQVQAQAALAREWQAQPKQYNMKTRRLTKSRELPIRNPIWNRHVFCLECIAAIALSAPAARTGAQSARTELDQYAEKIVAKLDWAPSEHTPPVVDETRQTYTTSPIEPRAEEQPAIVADAAAASMSMAT